MVATPALADRGWGGGYHHRDRDDTGAFGGKQKQA